MSSLGASSDSIFTEGVLEILPDGRGFLRLPEVTYPPGNYRPAVDDVQVSEELMERFDLHQGDSVSGGVRPPTKGETHFVLIAIDRVNSQQPVRRSHF